MATAQSKSTTVVYGYGYEERLAEQRRLMADPHYRRRMRKKLMRLRRWVLKRQAAGLCRVVESDGRWTVTAPEPATTRKPDACLQHAPSRNGRAAPRRRRELRRSSSRSADSGDDAAPPWPRRLAARLALRLADAAGYPALVHAVRHDFTRKGWSA